jgi:ABC-type phosphate transport system auxiliary subunit
MTEVSRVAAQTSEMYRQLDIKKLDKRHEELRLEEQRVRLNLKDNEEKRIEMNRRMNRPGQNVDRMA